LGRSSSALREIDALSIEGNPIMATAAKMTIAEVEEIVEDGELEPDQIHTPGIYVKRIIAGHKYQKRIERCVFRTTRC
jgi:acyl CoA:acetate/3-ketoacid CoA transferase alpha subunit